MSARLHASPVRPWAPRAAARAVREVGAFLAAPVEGLVVSGEREGVAQGRQRVEGDAPAGGAEEGGGGGCGVQVPGEEPLQGAVPLRRCLLGEDDLGGVDAQQVLQGVAAGCVLNE